MKFTSILLIAILTIVSFLASCSLFTPMKDFERHLKLENRCKVTFWKANDGTDRISTQIDYPNNKAIYVDGADASKFLTETERNRAIYQYVGEWDASEKKIAQNLEQEYQKWLSGRRNE
jgi:hypothetical protein